MLNNDLVCIRNKNNNLKDNNENNISYFNNNDFD